MSTKSQNGDMSAKHVAADDLLIQVRAKFDYAEGRDSWGLTVYNADLVAPTVEALLECAAALEWLAGRHAAFLKSNPEFSRAEYFADDRQRDLTFEREMAAYEALRKLAEVSKPKLAKDALDELTAERERAKGLVEALEKVDELSKVRHSGIQSGQIARDALAAYKGETK